LLTTKATKNERFVNLVSKARILLFLCFIRLLQQKASQLDKNEKDS